MTSDSRGFSASAYFDVAAEAPPAPFKETCVLTLSGAERAQATTSASAGDIVIRLPSNGAPTSSTLSFDMATKSYVVSSLDGLGGRVEKANAPIHLHAKGGAIPAFDVDVLSAFDTTLLEPAEGASLPANGEDLLVRWSDGGNDTVFSFLSVGGALVACHFPAAAGKGAIPGAMIQKAVANANLAACSGSCTAIGVSATRVATTIAVGDYDILVSHSVMSSRSIRAAQ